MATLRLGDFGYDASGVEPFTYGQMVVLERTDTLLSGELRQTSGTNVTFQLTGRFVPFGGAELSAISSVRATVGGALLYELRELSGPGNRPFQAVVSQDSIYTQSRLGDIFAGDDVLVGGAGDDTLSAQAGNNIILGGGGYDIADISTKQGQVAALRWRSEALITRINLSLGRPGLPETDRLGSIEAVRFIEGTVALADLPQFRPLQYLASYADLPAAYGTDQDQAWQHFLNNGSVEQRQVTFSGHAYLASYSDLRAAYGTDAEAAARHYLLYGRAEGRAVTSEFSAAQYLAANADLRGAFGADLDRAALHYLQYGAAEGRATSFDGLGYIASQPDLIRILPHTVNAGALHFVETGAKAGFGITFDPLRYIASNRDLADEFGIDTSRATRHYVDHGATENRPLSRFDAARYLETYADLRAAFGTDTRAATVHWIETGAEEGRAGLFDPPPREPFCACVQILSGAKITTFPTDYQDTAPN